MLRKHDLSFPRKRESIFSLRSPASTGVTVGVYAFRKNTNYDPSAVKVDANIATERKIQEMKRMKRRRQWIIITIIGLVILGGVAVWRIWFPGKAFDPIAWQDEGQMQHGIRLGMADRLIARGTLKNMARTEVVKLLGEPPQTDYFSDWDLVYWLGPERSFISIDSEWLVLRLGTDEHVVNCRIVRD